MTDSQWLFPVDALDFTPSTCSRERELYDRARGVEFLFRLGAALALLVDPFTTQLNSISLFSLAPLLPCVLRQLGFTDSSCVVPWRIFIDRCPCISLPLAIGADRHA
jgi:hypothetical protein